MGTMRQLMDDLGYAKDPNDWSFHSNRGVKARAILRPAQIASVSTVGTFADEYLNQPYTAPAKAVTSTRSAASMSAADPAKITDTLKKMDEELARQQEERAKAARREKDLAKKRKTASLIWMAQNHPDKMGRGAKQCISDLAAGRMPFYRSFDIDAEVIECCHLSNFRRDPDEPSNHSWYVEEVERAVRSWNHECDEDLRAAADGNGVERMKAKRTAKADAAQKAADLAEQLKLDEEQKQRDQRAELLRQREATARQLAVAKAEERQADLGLVVDQLLADEVGGEW